MSVTNPELEGAKIEKYVKWGAGFIAAGIAAPVVYGFAMDLIEAMWALAGLAGSAMILWMIGPALATWAANKRIQLLKAAAAANPIETMQNIYSDRSAELKLKEDAVVEMGTQVGNVEKKIHGLPAEEVGDYEEILVKLQEGYSEMKDEYKFCQAELVSYSKQIDKAERLWDVAQAINKALAVNASARAKVFADIKNKVAFDTVNNNLSNAFSRLNMAIEKHKSGVVGGDESKVVEGEVVAPKALPAAQISNVTNISQLRETTRKVGRANG